METITTSDELRLYNRSRILTCLRETGRQSRTSIGEYTGLSAATVTQVTASLINDGVIRQVSPRPINAPAATGNTRRGRPQVILELKPEAATTAIVTVLLNQIEVILFDYAGTCKHRLTKKLVTASLTAATMKNNLTRLIDAALIDDDHYRTSLKHIAVVFQGTVTSSDDGLLWSPITNVSNFNLRQVLQDRYDVWVTVSNDCNTIARALYTEQRQNPEGLSVNSHHQKPPQPATNFAVILLSYGIGLGFYHRGAILTGSHSSGTEFGHMLYRANGALCRCGRQGCIEAYASDYAIWRHATGLPSDTLPEDKIPEEEFSRLIRIATEKPGRERNAFIEAGAAIGQGLTNLFALFDPFPTLFVGTSAVAFTLMEESLQKNLRHYDTQDAVEYVSVYNNHSEIKLIQDGASQQALSYIDREIFGFGERITAIPDSVKL